MTYKKMDATIIAEEKTTKLKQLQKESPEILELLYCCSYLHHEDIPETLIEPFAATTALAEKSSLITLNKENNTFSIQPLFQEAIRDELDDKVHIYLLKMAALLYKLYPLKTTMSSDRADVQLKQLLKNHLDDEKVVFQNTNAIEPALSCARSSRGMARLDRAFGLR